MSDQVSLFIEFAKLKTINFYIEKLAFQFKTD